VKPEDKERLYQHFRRLASLYAILFTGLITSLIGLVVVSFAVLIPATNAAYTLNEEPLLVGAFMFFLLTLMIRIGIWGERLQVFLEKLPALPIPPARLLK
jgi:polyferredoxin